MKLDSAKFSYCQRQNFFCMSIREELFVGYLYVVLKMKLKQSVTSLIRSKNVIQLSPGNFPFLG